MSVSQFLKVIESDPEVIDSAFQPLIKAPLNSFGQTATHLLALRGNARALLTLLDMGADPNAEDVYRRRPLHLAAANGHSQIIEILLQHGADIDAQTSGGDTPLMKACLFSHRTAVEVLLQHHADVSLNNNDSQMATNYADMAQSSEIRDLLTRNADAQASD